MTYTFDVAPTNNNNNNNSKKKLRSKPHVPRYLIQRKLEILKTKVILRKFGYLFCYKTYGRILPSVAKKWHNKQILRQSFHKWVENWFNETCFWKLDLRAKVHFEFKCKKNYMKKWRQFIAQKQLYAIIDIFIKSYYTKKLKIKYLSRLKMYVYIKRREEYLLQRVQRTYSIICQVMYIQELLIWVTNLQQEYIYNLIASNHRKIYMLKKYFKCFQNYHVMKKIKYIKREKANIFFKNKYTLKKFQYIFDAWKIYHESKMKRKLNKNISISYFNLKLMKRTYVQLVKNCKDNQKLRKQIEKAENYHKTRIFNNTLKTWINFVETKKRQYYLNEKSNTHFQNKLKRKILLEWLATHRKLKILYGKINILMKNKNFKCLKQSFIIWKIFYAECLKEHEAVNFFNYKILKNYFYQLIIFKTHEKHRIENSMIIAKKYYITKIINLKMICFYKWRTFYSNQIQIQIKLEQFIFSQTFKFIKATFITWKLWTRHQIETTVKYMKLNEIFNKLTLRPFMKNWILHVESRKVLKLRLVEAKENFNKLAIDLVMNSMIKMGNKNLAVKYSDILEEQRAIFFKKALYFKKWKYAVWQKRKYSETPENPLFLSTTFNSQCLQPKIPIYFQI